MQPDALDSLLPDEMAALGGSGEPPWPDPIPLRAELPPVERFDEGWLPEAFRRATVDIAERMQSPIDFPATALVSTLAGAVNRRASIQPKANDSTWTVVPNLWGGIIAPPGFMKSPAIAAATKALGVIDAEYRESHDRAVKDYEIANERYELKRQAFREMVKSAFKGNRAAPPEPDAAPDKPVWVRLMVNDCTFEAMHETMRDNPAGLLLLRDELSGWWATLDRQGREGERAFYLQAWNGDTGHTVDRIGRGSIHVPACCLSLLGGIQPSKLRYYLTDMLHGGPTDDGLIQRFQLLVWPDLPEAWALVDREPDQDALLQVETILRAVVRLSAENPVRYRFAPDAQELFNEWLADLEGKVRSDDIHPALAGHLSKYRSLMPSLALLFELADRAGTAGFEGSVASHEGDSQKIGLVSLQHTKRAAAVCSYLESHARRVYSCVVTPQIRAAHVLARKIEKRKVAPAGTFSVRQIYLKGWAGLDTPDLARQAVQVLEDAGWIRPVDQPYQPQGGRPSDRYQINPKVRQ